MKPVSTAIGILHPGEMGAAVGARLAERGHDVAWSAEGRSDATRERAAHAGLIVSVCPPHAALDVAAAVAATGYGGVFVDANAVAPATVASIRAVVEGAGARLVDGGVVGPPPEREGTTRLFLSGAGADDV